MSAGPQEAAEPEARDFLHPSLRRQMSQNLPGGLSAAQMARHVLIQAVNVPGSIHWSLQPPRERGGQVRSLLPLPLWHDTLDVMRHVVEDQVFRDRPGQWRMRGGTRSKAGRALRSEGVAIWHGLVVLSLNHMNGEWGAVEGPQPASEATAPQEAALQRIRSAIEIFVDEKAERGVPRSWDGDWASKLDSLRVSYTGETVEKALPLSLGQVLPALPSKDHGGIVRLVDVLPRV